MNGNLPIRRKGGRAGKRRTVLLLLLCFLALLGTLAAFFLWFKGVIGVNDRMYHSEIRLAARKYRLDPELVRALIWQESKFRLKTVGKAGEIGLMQILPEGAVADWAKANRCRVPSKRQLFRPEVNLEIGCFYLALCLRRWQSYRASLQLGLAHYNAGYRRATQWKPEKPETPDILDRIGIPSTRAYVSAILKRYAKYQQERRKTEKDR